MIRFIALYFKNIFIAVDQLINTVLFGYPDETLSSRSYRWSQFYGFHYFRFFIDTLFFFDKDGDKKHCELAFISEREDRQQAPEARK